MYGAVGGWEAAGKHTNTHISRDILAEQRVLKIACYANGKAKIMDAEHDARGESALLCLPYDAFAYMAVRRHVDRARL